MSKIKILKIHSGEVYIEGKSYPVYKTAWPRKDKEGNVHFVVENRIFVNEIEKKEKEEEVKKTAPSL